MKQKKICFISETRRSDRPLHDPSVRYRAYHPAEALLKKGHICTIYSASQFFTNPSFNYDIYIFHRPSISRKMFPEVIKTLKRLGRQLICDYDDLIFGNEEAALTSSAVKNGTLTPKDAILAYSNNLEALFLFDQFTVSTTMLAERINKVSSDAKILISPNFIPDSILSVQEYLGTPFRKRSDSIIGYFAGTKSHDRDLPEIEEALHRVLSENSQFKLLIVGPVAITKALASLPSVTTLPAVNYLRLPSLMSKCNTVIAPLENSAFNECKSRVKFLEAALSGCRLIASPITDMRQVGSNHITLANNLDEWYESLSQPITSIAQEKLMKRNFALLKSFNTVDNLIKFGEFQ